MDHKNKHKLRKFLKIMKTWVYIQKNNNILHKKIAIGHPTTCVYQFITGDKNLKGILVIQLLIYQILIRKNYSRHSTLNKYHDSGEPGHGTRTDIPIEIYRT